MKEKKQKWSQKIFVAFCVYRFKGGGGGGGIINCLLNSGGGSKGRNEVDYLALIPCESCKESMMRIFILVVSVLQLFLSLSVCVCFFVCWVYLCLAPFLKELHPHCWVSWCACMCERGVLSVQVRLLVLWLANWLDWTARLSDFIEPTTTTTKTTTKTTPKAAGRPAGLNERTRNKLTHFLFFSSSIEQACSQLDAFSSLAD